MKIFSSDNERKITSTHMRIFSNHFEHHAMINQLLLQTMNGRNVFLLHNYMSCLIKAHICSLKQNLHANDHKLNASSPYVRREHT